MSRDQQKLTRPFNGHYDALIMSNAEARDVYTCGYEDGHTAGYAAGRADLIQDQLKAQQEAVQQRTPMTAVITGMDAAEHRRRMFQGGDTR